MHLPITLFFFFTVHWFQILSIAIAKGQLNQSVQSRLASCQIIGKVATRFDSFMWVPISQNSVELFLTRSRLDLSQLLQLDQSHSQICSLSMLPPLVPFALTLHVTIHPVDMDSSAFLNYHHWREFQASTPRSFCDWHDALCVNTKWPLIPPRSHPAPIGDLEYLSLVWIKTCMRSYL